MSAASLNALIGMVFVLLLVSMLFTILFGFIMFKLDRFKPGRFEL